LSTVYPSNIDDKSTLPQAVDLKTPVKAEVVNNLRDAIIALENELGIDPSSTYGTVRARLDAMQAGGGGGGSPIDVRENGVTIVSNITSLNFTGGATVTDGGLGVANINASGGSSGSTDGYAPIYEQLTLSTNGQTIFSLSNIPARNNLVLLFISGIKQIYGTDYTVSGQTLTYNNNPSLVVGDDVLDVFYFIPYTISGGGGGSSLTAPTDPSQNGYVVIASGGDLTYLGGSSVGNVLTWNGSAWVSQAPSGGGGAGTLKETLSLGNLTDGYNIVISNGDAISIGDISISQDGYGVKFSGTYGGGGSITLSAADENAGGNPPGAILIESGGSTNYNGADISLLAGGSSITGGDISIQSGSGGSANGGTVSIASGAGGNVGGNISIDAGNGGSGVGGNVSITSGDSTAGAGYVYLLSGSSGSNNGSSVYMSGAQESTNTGGSINIVCGNGNTTGGSLLLQSGEGLTGGSISILAEGYDTTGTISIVTSPPLNANGTSGQINIRTGDAGGDSGWVRINTGDASYGQSGEGTSGSIEIYTGNGGAGGDLGNSGNISISTRDGYSSGDIFIFTGGSRSVSSSPNGNIRIQSGDNSAADGYGGNIRLNAGNAASGYGGDIEITSGTGSKHGNICIGLQVSGASSFPLSTSSNILIVTESTVSKEGGIVYLSSSNATLAGGGGSSPVYLRSGSVNSPGNGGLSTGLVLLKSGDIIDSAGGGATGTVTVSTGDNLIGNTQQTGQLVLKSGDSFTTSSGSSGSVTLSSGSIDTGGPSGTVLIKSGNQTNAGTGGGTGSVELTTGQMFGGGSSGNTTISTGATTVSPAGTVIIAPGDSSSSDGGSIELRPGSGGSGGSLRIYSASGSVNWTWPQADGSSGHVLTTDGSGGLSFAAASGGGGSESVIDGYFTSNQNDYSPTGWSTATHIRLSTDAARTITGFASVSAPSTRYIINTGSFNITLSHNSGSSATGNKLKIQGGVDFVLEPDDVATLWKDPTTNVWRIL
jgi:hypothetical protein